MGMGTTRGAKAHSILDMKETAFVHRAVSSTYTITVGYAAASDSEMIWPEADQVKISICPGVSKSAYLGGVGEAARLPISSSTCAQRTGALGAGCAGGGVRRGRPWAVVGSGEGAGTPARSAWRRG